MSIEEGIYKYLNDKQLSVLSQDYTPKYNNSDVSNCLDIEDFSEHDQTVALEEVQYELIEKLREIFDKDNPALIELEKIILNC